MRRGKRYYHFCYKGANRMCRCCPFQMLTNSRNVIEGRGEGGGGRKGGGGGEEEGGGGRACGLGACSFLVMGLAPTCHGQVAVATHRPPRERRVPALCPSCQLQGTPAPVRVAHLRTSNGRPSAIYEHDAPLPSVDAGPDGRWPQQAHMQQRQ
jgi:hypothetical protein